MNCWLNSKNLFGSGLFKPVFKAFLILMICMTSEVLWAQSIQINGKVTNSEAEVLIGVNVLNENSGAGTTTDFEGEYIIEANTGDWLVYSYVGYTTERRQVTESMDGNLILKTNADVLDEVIVVGYGTLRSSKVSSSVSKLDSKALNNSTFARVDQAMAGKIAGVQVQEVSGSPGAGLAVKIRGVGSISNSNSPLYVVDGFPISGDLSAINPKDIESIEVLKDAASAAIYGSRGSNGVVLITTKQGKEGKAVINFSSTFALQEQLDEVGVLNKEEYLEFAIEERTNSAIYQGIDPSTLTSRPPSHQYSIDPLWISNPESFPDNNWQDLIGRKAPMISNQLSVSGKTENFKYYTSLNYLNQEGIIVESDFERLSFRSNIEGSPSDKLTFGLNLNLINSDRNDPRTDWNQGPVSRSLYVAPIVMSESQTQNGGYYPYHASFFLNPIVLAKEIDNSISNQRLLGNPYVQIEPVKNLFIKTSGGFDVSNFTTNYYITNNINRGRGSIGSLSGNKRRNILSETTATYSFLLRDFEFSLLSGFSYQKERYDSYIFEKTGFPDDDIKTLNAGTVINSANSEATEWAMLSYFGRVNMDYEGKYILTTSLRRDGSSRFGENNKWGLFPSLSLGWNLDRESFMVNNKIFSSVKIRASIGATGNNNIGNYSSTGRIAQRNYVDENGNVVTGYSPGTFSNPDLTWESTNILDFGADLGFWKDRLNITLDYYIANTSDLLLNVPIPGITGNTSTLQNIGKVENKGVELEVKSNNISGNFNWTTYFNISHNRNKVKELGPTGSPIFGYSSGYLVTKTEIGRSIGEYYMFETDGVFMNREEVESYPNYKRQDPGDFKYVDQNGDGMITLEEDRTYIGSNLPKFIYGLTNEFSWSHFTFTFFIDGQYGNKVLNIAALADGQSRGNVHDYWLDRWKSPENPGNGKVPRAAVTDNLTTTSDFWLHNASFVRLKNISLSYGFSDSLLSKIKAIKTLRLHLRVDNAVMLDEFYHKVQAGSFSNSALVPGVEYNNTYPMARTFSCGLDISF